MSPRLPRLLATATVTLLLGLGLGLPAARAATPDQALAHLARALGQQATADATFEAIASRTAALRGLTPREPVERHFLTPEQYREQVVQDLNDPDSLKEIENSRKLMVALGLLAPDADLYALELQFRSSIVLGQYDPDTKELDVVTGADENSPSARVTLAHEFTHALQDQYYDIRRLMPKHSDNSDRDLAVSALLEGDALITQELYALQALTPEERSEEQREEADQGNSVDFDSLPLVMVEETYFPYTEGPRFIAAVIGRDTLRQAIDTGKGYGPAVDRIFDNPPQSTAQILHPEKYLAGIAPIAVELPDLAAALGQGWQQLEKDVLGEIDHRILIQQFLGRDRGVQAAAGWAGDAYALLGNGDQSAVVVSSRWDSPAAAQAWLAAYADAVQARYGSRLQVVEQRPDGVLWQTPDGAQAVDVSGTSTNIIIAPSQEAVRSLERTLLGAPPTVLRSFAPAVGVAS